MERYIKYKRFEYNRISKDKLQDHFDELIMNGWEIISYYEERILNIENIPSSIGGVINTDPIQLFLVVVIAGKRQNNTLG